MNGSIVLNNPAGRALRRGAADVFARDVLDCAGAFESGDAVYLTFRAADGGQYALATGIACCSGAELRRKLKFREDAIVLRGENVRLLWG